MPQDNIATLFSGNGLKFRGDFLPDAAQFLQPSGSGGNRHRVCAVFGCCALCRHDDGKTVTAFFTLHYFFRHDIDIVRNLRDEDGIGGGGNARIEGDPPGVATHDLNNHDPAMGFCSRVEPVDTFGGEMNRRIKTEGYHRLVQIVVDGLWHTHHPQPFLMQCLGNGQGTVTADGNKRVEPMRFKLIDEFIAPIDFINPAVFSNRRKCKRVIAVCGPQYRSPQMGNPPNGLSVKRDQTALWVLIR